MRNSLRNLFSRGRSADAEPAEDHRRGRRVARPTTDSAGSGSRRRAALLTTPRSPRAAGSISDDSSDDEISSEQLRQLMEENKIYEAKLARIEKRLHLEPSSGDSKPRDDKTSPSRPMKRDIDSAAASVSSKASASAAWKRDMYGIDVCFLMDCTGSMASYIDECKSQLEKISKAVHETFPDVFIRMAFVGYRDLNDKPPHFVLDFTESVPQVANFVKTIKATGGADAPEDIAGALKRVHELSWRCSTKLVIHFADAPCHGKKYHSCADDYPLGDPNGLVPEKLVEELASKAIDYYFAHINTTTATMERIFKEQYKYVMANNAAQFEVHDFTSGPKNFVPAVVRSIKSSTKLHSEVVLAKISHDSGITTDDDYGLSTDDELCIAAKVTK